MKKIISKGMGLWMAISIFSLGIVFWGCSREDNICMYEQNKSGNYPFLLTVDYNNIHDVYAGEDVSEILLWNHYQNDSLLVAGNVLLAYEEWDHPQFLQIDEGAVVITNGVDTVQLSNFKQVDDVFSFQAVGIREIPISLSIKSKLYNYDYVTASLNQKVPWMLIYAAACLIANIVDAACDNKIANDVAACTQQKKCSIVHTCGADCVECNKN